MILSMFELIVGKYYVARKLSGRQASCLCTLSSISYSAVDSICYNTGTYRNDVICHSIIISHLQQNLLIYKHRNVVVN